MAESNTSDKTPVWALLPFRRFRTRLGDEVRFLHLTMKGLDHLAALPRLREALDGLTAELNRARSCDGSPPTKHGKESRRLGSEDPADSEWLGREIQAGYPQLHAHSVVAIWGTLEVFSEDLSVAWLANRPAAWDAYAIQKLKAPVAQIARYDAVDRARFVVRELTRGRGPDTTGGGVLDPLLDVFGLSPKYGENIRKALHELWQVRNVVVHCGSIADQRLLDHCPWLEVEVGQHVTISHLLYGWYQRAALRYAERVMNEVWATFGDPICRCPGMDNVEERPLNPQTLVSSNVRRLIRQH